MVLAWGTSYTSLYYNVMLHEAVRCDETCVKNLMVEQGYGHYFGSVFSTKQILETGQLEQTENESDCA